MLQDCNGVLVSIIIGVVVNVFGANLTGAIAVTWIASELETYYFRVYIGLNWRWFGLIWSQACYWVGMSDV